MSLILVTLYLGCYTRFPRSSDIVVGFGFSRNLCSFNIITIALNIPNSTLHGQIFFCKLPECDVTSFFLNFSTLRWLKVWSENNLIIATFMKLNSFSSAVEKEDFINIEKLKYTENFQPLTNFTKSSQSLMLQVS